VAGKVEALLPETLVINGAECDPYLSCDDRLMRERSEDVLDGIRIIAHALGVTRILIGIENYKPEAQKAMEEAIARLSPTPSPLPKPAPSEREGVRGASCAESIQVAHLPTRYPMGSEKYLVQTVTGNETPDRGLTADLGVVVHNPATAMDCIGCGSCA
jgi:electron transport complex protein RnfC